MDRFDKIAVIDGLSWTKDYAKREIETLSKAPVTFPKDYPKSEKEIIKRIGDADCVLLSWQTTLTANVLQKCPNIKYIGLSATTLANLPVSNIEKRGIVLKNVVNYSGEAAAEYIFMQLLMLIRGLHGYRWKEDCSELNGKTIGILGLGDVGKHVALRSLGFNMKVLYYQRRRDEEFEAKGLRYAQLEELLQKSDIITIHLPTNTHIIHKKELRLIREGAILVNTTLGKVFDASEFSEWLNKGKNFAIFDADAETSELKNCKNIIIGDQEAGKSLEGADRLSQKLVSNIKTYLAEH
jgi:phosphoglycerate dehydrogenase-like enzyme